MTFMQKCLICASCSNSDLQPHNAIKKARGVTLCDYLQHTYSLPNHYMSNLIIYWLTKILLMQIITLWCVSVLVWNRKTPAISSTMIT